MKTRILILLAIIVSSFGKLRADEGMWLPILLQSLNEKEMQNMGFKLTADDIYSINHGSMKDAVVLFGGGCTAEIVSEEGLILTNHHCGYGSIQKHSTVDNDLLTKGFWAANNNEELANQGLTATILVYMEDVTTKVLKNVKKGMSETEREAIIEKECEKIEKDAKKGKYKTQVKSFYYGNNFYLFVYEVFEDVRLVGCPPSAIGKFGGDTDNWMWPRHTGDFSVFRIYANKNNEPAKYSKDNVPYKPKYHFPISTKGVKKDDFTFVFGYPGSTQHFTVSQGVKYITENENPAAINLRQIRMDIMKKHMAKNDTTRIQYSAKVASVANFWKKMIGESKGIREWDGIEKRITMEKEFAETIKKDKELYKKYSNLLKSFDDIYSKIEPYNTASNYFFEGIWSLEAFKFAWSFDQYIAQCVNDPKSANLISMNKKLKTACKNFFAGYNANIDKEITASILKEMKKTGTQFLPKYYFDMEKKFAGNWEAATDYIFSKSIFVSQKKTEDFLNLPYSKVKKYTKDPMYVLASEFIFDYLNNIEPKSYELNGQLDSLYRVYTVALKEVFPNKIFYPDANSTLRVSYGNVKSYTARDGIDYAWFSTLDGIIEKSELNISDYTADTRLKDLYFNKNYGPYADSDGSMHVAFIATNHTTGGNSGSPVLNANGELIGINFDRVWEGTMSDLMFDSSKCRNISVDIRYVLFVIDKYANASHLINEMTLK